MHRCVYKKIMCGVRFFRVFCMRCLCMHGVDITMGIEQLLLPVTTQITQFTYQPYNS